MRSARFGRLLCCLLLITTPALAQQASSGALGQDKQAATLLQASLAALMASTTVLPNTLAESGTLTPLKGDNTASYAVRIYMQGVDKFRWEADLPNGTTATVVNGQDAQSQIASTSNPLEAWQVGGRKVENFPAFLLSRWLNADGIEARFVGLKTIDGLSLNHISIVDHSQRIRPLNPWKRDGHRGEYELYIDPATSLPARLHFYQDTSDTYLLSLAPVDIVYSDYRVVAGSVFPFMLTRYLGRTKLSVLQLQSVVPGAAVPISGFEIR
jgi:hypothetical protein